MNAQQKRRLADQLREAIKRSEFGQNEIARRSEVDKGTMSKFMAGDRGLSLEAIERIAAVLNLQLVEKKKRGE